ncbi:MAG: hydroxymethylbilane synthase [Rhodospirillales bacterium]|nr:hydroxymethylbilane synthase [Rhodospirillales bacterium]MXX23778.1 hydroxymethylbilane synthase [Rhodospirillales bacterium]MYE19606.1 hydroxymethylbilane synthase [Rhodospirillales bacterium]
MRLRIGTRNSDLARAQSAGVAAQLAAAGHAAELVPITTAGDQSREPVFAAIGPQGVFVREISQALVDGAIDLAVHSYKDVPTGNPDELVIAAVPARLDAADCLLIRTGHADHDGGFLPLPAGARVGTSSVRRQSWLKHLRADLRPVPLRGNVPTRVRRLQEGSYDAIVLATAGLDRLRARHSPSPTALDLTGVATVRLDPERFVPAPAQGALALQCRQDRDDVRAALVPLDHPATREAIDAERLLLGRLEGGCELAFGAYCRAEGTDCVMHAMLEREGRVWVETGRGPEPSHVAGELWRLLGSTGAGDPATA